MKKVLGFDGMCKGCFLALVLLTLSLRVLGQSCDCPPIDACGMCQGGFTKLTFRYNGAPSILLSASDGGGVIVFSLFLTTGQTFTAIGSLPNGNFQGNELIVRVFGIVNFTLDTSCGTTLSLNADHGSFTLVGAESMAGGALCCSTPDLDTTDPVIANCPNDVQVFLGQSCSIAVPWTVPTASDNCGAVTLTSTHDPGGQFTKGTTSVVYTATDDYGNTASCSFNVTAVDNTGPQISGCPGDITANTNTSCRATVTWTLPTALDNCSGTVVLTSSKNPGDEFPLGSTLVTYTATDGEGNTSTCTFNVIVEDNAPPVIGERPDIVVSTGNACEATANWTAPTVNDCSQISLAASHDSGDSFPVGTTEVTYTATDENGNTATATFNIIVEDKSPPEFQQCPDDIVINPEDACEGIVRWTEPTATDNCEGVMVERTHGPGDVFSVGTTEVKYTATDAFGNVSICRFKVIVKIENPPAIENCPNDLHLKCDEYGKAAGEWIPPSASTMCGNVTLTASHQPGDLFAEGTTTVEYQAEDASGNISRCKFNVVVTRPVIELDISKVITPDDNGINDEWIVKNIEKFKDNKIVIVDRWGSVIYSATGYNNESIVWKGNNQRGDRVPTGTYFFTISARFGPDLFEKSGSIELIR